MIESIERAPDRDEKALSAQVSTERETRPLCVFVFPENPLTWTFSNFSLAGNHKQRSNERGPRPGIFVR